MRDKDLLPYWHKLQRDLQASKSWTPTVAASWRIAKSQLDEIPLREPGKSYDDYAYYLQGAKPIVEQHILRVRRLRDGAKTV